MDKTDELGVLLFVRQLLHGVNMATTHVSRGVGMSGRCLLLWLSTKN